MPHEFRSSPRWLAECYEGVFRRGDNRLMIHSTSPMGKLPRVTRLMALAIKFDGLLRDGLVRDYADLARLGHVTRARMTQLMGWSTWRRTFRRSFCFCRPSRRGVIRLQSATCGV